MSEHQTAVSRRDVIRRGAMVAAGVAIVAPTDAASASESVSKRFETLATVHIEINGVTGSSCSLASRCSTRCGSG